MKGRKTTLYILFLIALLLPLFQMITRLFPEPMLRGTFVRHNKPALTAESWFNGNFQSEYELYVNDSLGFHSNLVKMRNLFCIKVFHQINNNSVVLGKDNYLYEQDYIDAHYGTDFIGRDSILQQVEKTKKLQDALEARGKTLVVFLAPSKADYLPEYIPELLRKAETDSTNHKLFSQLLKQHGVNVIDYNSYYLSQKASTPYPLYPQYGIHWSKYGTVHATDSLVRYIAGKSGLQLPRLIIDRYEVSDNPQFTDYDLGSILNIAGGSMKSFPLCYPEWHWTSDTISPRPTLTVVSDSYYWEVYNMQIQEKCFQGWFWYYNSTVYPESFTKETFTNEMDMKEVIEKSDVILIMSTTPGLRTFSWGAIDNFLKAL